MGLITRRRFLTSFAGVFAAGLATGAYALAIEPGWRLRVVTHRLRPAGWPNGVKLRIAALADPHMGEPYMPLSRLERIVDKTNALKPDLTVLLGDFVAGHRFVSKPVKIADTARVCAGLRAPLGAWSILGNHDWWDDLTAQRNGHGPTIARRALETAGIPVLENDAAQLVAPAGAPFWLAGLGDQLAFPRRGFRGVDDMPATIARLTDDEPAILLAHEPDIFPDVPNRFALTLSGHTHGGQVSLLGWRPVVPSRFGGRYAWGHIREGGRDLIVSGGLGCSILPVRLGVPPEITLIELG